MSRGLEHQAHAWEKMVSDIGSKQLPSPRMLILKKIYMLR